MSAALQSSRAIAFARLALDPKVMPLFESLDDQYRAYRYRYGREPEKLHDEIAWRMWRIAEGEPNATFVYGADFPELAILPKKAPDVGLPIQGAQYPYRVSYVSGNRLRRMTVQAGTRSHATAIAREALSKKLGGEPYRIKSVEMKAAS